MIYFVLGFVAGTPILILGIMIKVWRESKKRRN